MSGICYYCGEPATSDEHVPPRAIFPKPNDSPDGRDYRKNLITVRSCDIHNTQKSKEDEYLRNILTMSITSNEIGKSQFLNSAMRAIKSRPKLIEQMLIGNQNITYYDIQNDIWDNSIAVKPDDSRLTGIFTSIVKALYMHEKGSPWLDEVRILIEFILSLDSLAKNSIQSEYVTQLDEYLIKVPYKGANPDVFTYQFVELGAFTCIRLHFYGNTKVTAILKSF
jgi:hypothetical protein